MEEDTKQTNGTQVRVSPETSERLRMWRARLALKNNGDLPSRDEVIAISLDALETLEGDGERVPA